MYNVKVTICTIYSILAPDNLITVHCAPVETDTVCLMTPKLDQTLQQLKAWLTALILFVLIIAAAAPFWGVPLNRDQGVYATCADLLRQGGSQLKLIDGILVEECKQLFMAGQLDVATVSMAKASATEMQGRVIDTCLQLHGGYGFMREYGVSRAYVDARVQRIYGGTSEIMKELISRSLLS